MTTPEQLLEKQKLSNQIWTEHIRKELATMQLNTEFIPNPYTMDLITDKPNRSTFKVMPQDAEQHRKQAIPEHFNRIQDIITSKLRAPKEKWEIPITTSHEYGWDQEMHQISKHWYRPRGSTGLTQYVQAYILSQGASPFAKKNTKPPSNTN